MAHERRDQRLGMLTSRALARGGNNCSQEPCQHHANVHVTISAPSPAVGSTDLLSATRSKTYQSAARTRTMQPHDHSTYASQSQVSYGR